MQLEDVGLGADVDAARRLVEQQHRGSVSSALPSTTFCWLPPLSEPIGASARRLDGDVAHDRSTASRSRRARPRPP
jgi:hypothetical protein